MLRRESTAEGFAGKMMSGKGKQITRSSTRSMNRAEASMKVAALRARKKPVKRTGTLGQVAAFASSIAKSGTQDFDSDGRDLAMNVDDKSDPNETGIARLKKFIKSNSEQSFNRGLFKFTSAGNSMGMDTNVLVRVAQEDEWQLVSCASLPFTICFFVIFVLFFQEHYGVADIFLAEKPFRRNLADSAVKLVHAADIYDWLETLYFPYLWAASPSTTSEQKTKVSSLYQELVAGVVVSTSRGRNSSCDDAIAKHMSCYSGEASGSNGNAFRATTSRRLRARGALVAERGQGARGPSVSLGIEHLPATAANVAGEWHPSARWVAWRRKRAGGVDSDGQPPRPRGGLLYGGRWPDRGRRLPEQNIRSVGGRNSRTPSAKERRLRINFPEARNRIPSETDGEMSKISIPIAKGLPDVLEEVRRWRDIQVIQETTNAFSVDSVLLNENLDRRLLTTVKITFGVHHGGQLFAHPKIVTLVLSRMSSDVVSVLIGPLWIVCLVAFSCMLPSRVYFSYKDGRCLRKFFRFWNLLEWGITLWGWLVLFSFVVERSLVFELKTHVAEYLDQRSTTKPEYLEELDTANIEQLAVKSSRASNVTQWVQIFVSLYHLILVFRFFLASRGQPRLAIVLATIRKASIDLLHLLIVFSVIFVAYAISGHILLGRRMQAFATFQGAFASCFAIVMEREYPWDELTERDLYTTMLWVWSFLLLIVLVMVNIFLAMIFDTYGDVHSSVGHNATLWQTTKIMASQLKHMIKYSSGWVPNRDVVNAIREMHCQFVMPWMLKDAIQGISNRQVNYLFNLAANRLEVMLIKGNRGSLPSVVASLLLGVQRLDHTLVLLTGSFVDNPSMTGIESVEGIGSLKRMPPPEKHRNRADEKLENDDEEERSKPPPDEAPLWVKVQLLPHVRKQHQLLNQVSLQVKRLCWQMRQRGCDAPLTRSDDRLRDALFWQDQDGLFSAEGFAAEERIPQDYSTTVSVAASGGGRRVVAAQQVLPSVLVTPPMRCAPTWCGHGSKGGEEGPTGCFSCSAMQPCAGSAGPTMPALHSSTLATPTGSPRDVLDDGMRTPPFRGNP